MDHLKNINPHQQVINEGHSLQLGEYVIIQTYPLGRKLVIRWRTFDYQEAWQKNEFENLSHDYSSYAVRQWDEGQLWQVDENGCPDQISLEQSWDIDPAYLAASRNPDTDGAIEIHRCSYPYFLTTRTRHNLYGEVFEYWQPVTCLRSDVGRSITCCPNCALTLIDFDDEEEVQPVCAACMTCQHYHGRSYGGNFLNCGIHPSGWEGESCPYFEDK